MYIKITDNPVFVHIKGNEQNIVSYFITEAVIVIHRQRISIKVFFGILKKNLNLNHYIWMGFIAFNNAVILIQFRAFIIMVSFKN